MSEPELASDADESDSVGWPTWFAPSLPPVAASEVDRKQSEKFAGLLFDGMAGWVNLRAIEEPPPAGRKAHVLEEWHPIGAGLSQVVGDFV